MFKEAVEEVNEDISINGKLVNNLRYADDIILLADRREGLQILVVLRSTVKSMEWL